MVITRVCGTLVEGFPTQKIIILLMKSGSRLTISTQRWLYGGLGEMVITRVCGTLVTGSIPVGHP